MMKKLIGLFLGGALLVPVALADSYKFENWYLGQSVTIYESANGTGKGTVAGLYHLTKLPGGSVFDVFCIDLWDDVNWGENLDLTPASLPNAPIVNNVSQPMGETKAGIITALIDKYYPLIGTAQDAANLQLAIWDVIAGGVDVTSSTWALPQGTIKDMINYATQYPGSPYKYGALTSAPLPNASRQDFVVLAVPDGGATLALLGMALGAISFLRRRA